VNDRSDYLTVTFDLVSYFHTHGISNSSTQACATLGRGLIAFVHPTLNTKLHTRLLQYSSQRLD